MNVSANDVFGESTFDEVLLPKFREILARPERRQLIVLHLLGSHDAYNKRYPDKFNRWKPSLTDHPDADYHDFRIRDEINNSYDNSILYTDYIISSVIDTLRANESLLSGLFYIADHGENIFDERCPLTGHGGTAYFGYPVSALAWISDRYAKAFTGAVQNLRAHAHSRLTTENIFDSLGDLAHLSYRGMDRSRSILSAEFRARPRMVNVGTEIVDWDHARFISECRKPAPIGITLAK
jgi:glucan phosphoethanolaminetransferase (alkaline phosphatase superfamily)